MSLILFLLVFPVISALLLLFFRHGIIRNTIVIVSAIVIAGGSILLLVKVPGLEASVNIPTEIVSRLMLAIETLIVAYISIVGIRQKRYLIPLLAVPQLAFLAYLELFAPVHAAHAAEFAPVAFDSLSLIMALVIGVVGPVIAIFALEYMKEYHQHHPQVRDRSNMFFSVFFLFLSAMFGIVFSNQLTWLSFFWEITTVASFVFIGYSQTEEAKKNAARALVYNLVGGVCLTAAIGFLHYMNLPAFLGFFTVKAREVALLPAVLLSVAGMAKAAQFPFAGWLRGAMVAPTPVSALLHSSTMVKAGVFLIIKISPVFSGTIQGFLVAAVGAFTFLAAAFIAISRKDAKEVLAYSTISNLGLIVLCAGVGTAEAVWAAILLLLFHALAKALLFCTVGLVEHRIGSRKIEDMDGLLRRMPRITYILLVGIAGMFLAPFGMLISKWAALKALVDANPILAVIVIFGSAATLFFWTKWMGKLTTVINPQPDIEKEVRPADWTSLSILALLTIMLCLFFPVASTVLIDPYISSIYHTVISMEQGNLLIMLIMLVMLIILPVILMISVIRGRARMEYMYTDAYLCGTNTRKPFKYFGSMGRVVNVQTENYYLGTMFSEKRIFNAGMIVSIAMLLILFVAAGIHFVLSGMVVGL